MRVSGVHSSYPADGHGGAWLATLDRPEVELAGLPLYPGHGSPGDVRLLRFLPGAPVSLLVGLGADAVAAELAGEPAPA